MKRKSKIKNRRRERGAVLVMTAIFAPVILGLSILGFDLGRLYIVTTRLQNIADLAALSGARTWVNKDLWKEEQGSQRGGKNDNGASSQGREYFAKKNHVEQSAGLVIQQSGLIALEEASIVLGIYTTQNGSFNFAVQNIGNETAIREQNSAMNAVQVTVTLDPDENSFLFGVFGIKHKIRRSAIAHICPNSSGGYFVMLGGVCPCGNGRRDAFIREVCDISAGDPASCTPPYQHAAPGANCTYCSSICSLEQRQGEYCGDKRWNPANEPCDSSAGANNCTACKCDDGYRPVEGANRCDPIPINLCKGNNFLDSGEQCIYPVVNNASICTDECLCNVAAGYHYQSKSTDASNRCIRCVDPEFWDPTTETCVGMCRENFDPLTPKPTWKDPNLAIWGEGTLDGVRN